MCGSRGIPHRGGKSSFGMHDAPRIFREMSLREGETFLDLGCGPGDYALYASEIVGSRGMVYALDRSKECVDSLQERARSRGAENIRGICGDLRHSLPLEGGCADCAFLATVLHGMDLLRDGDALFREIRRVLAPRGRLVIVECAKKRTTFGPPEEMRLAPEFLEEFSSLRGFERKKYVDLGHTYMIEFLREIF